MVSSDLSCLRRQPSPGQVVHWDLVRSISVLFSVGALYFGTFSNDFCRWTDVVFLQKTGDLLAEY